jgi:hypothetical protein
MAKTTRNARTIRTTSIAIPPNNMEIMRTGRSIFSLAYSLTLEAKLSRSHADLARECVANITNNSDKYQMKHAENVMESHNGHINASANQKINASDRTLTVPIGLLLYSS